MHPMNKTRLYATASTGERFRVFPGPKFALIHTNAGDGDRVTMAGTFKTERAAWRAPIIDTVRNGHARYAPAHVPEPVFEVVPVIDEAV